MDISRIPAWIEDLEDDDFLFIKKFLLASGSLKEMAKEYSVTYPTVRLRLDRLIDRIKLSEKSKELSYVELIKKLALEEKIELSTAKLLISEYKKEHGQA